MKYLFLLILSCISVVGQSQHINTEPIGSSDQKPRIDTNIYTSVEQPPILKNRTDWKQYVEANIRYPVEVKAGKLTGQVLVAMLIEKDGTLKNIKIVKGLNVDCDQEALRLVEQSPKWLPGINNGRSVRSIYTVTISFAAPSIINPNKPLAFRTIPGKLVDKNGSPLNGWQTLIYGTNDGNSTYPDGHFSLDVPNQPVMVAISFHATPKIFVIVKPTDTALNVKLSEATEKVAFRNIAEWEMNSKYNLKHVQDLYKSEEYRRYMGWIPKDATDESILADIPNNISQQSTPLNKIYMKTDVQPKLLTSSVNWDSFVSRNIEYPKEAMTQQLRGKVFIGFIIGKDGIVSDITILKGLRGDCNEAALKVVKLSKWKPGLVNDVPVRCFHGVIVDFRR